ncbi:hydroxymethylglutaryl-CoA lyase [Alteromonas sp. KC3]|uniref:hydroxymethylglutaryl-CoA lyase n=1 Tax=unclassified Alteromonas TaxID=2614992 RepID=UPI001920E145|nr:MULTISPECIES: hydroxymethylglutaryl-CoA lyase [unclassified Alteromonas]BCO18768.1 hydroxymethylglutaryl-CoA lyase [Alteromonas sp. KC3]BCO22731.1 hydroxymethylglutaryl-CoA lyase [Alteromonas sp. KC14]
MAFPSHVSIVEVGPRDGLQNEKQLVTTADKLTLINLLGDAGLTRIEAGSFVSPKWVPQMADSGDIFKQLTRKQGVQYSALTPNMKGLDAALEAGVEEVAVFGAASESFSQKNINCSISESLSRFEPVIEKAKALNIPVRGYVSCVMGCPYEGKIAPKAVADVSKTLLDMGCYEISLGDTIGTGTPGATKALMDEVLNDIPVSKIAVHFHDTYGQALVNLYTAMEYGVAVIDSAVSGLGGCPYAKGASGNVATEDVVYMLNGMGITSNVDMDKLLDTSRFVQSVLGRPPVSKVATALLAK